MRGAEKGGTLYLPVRKGRMWLLKAVYFFFLQKEPCHLIWEARREKPHFRLSVLGTGPHRQLLGLPGVQNPYKRSAEDSPDCYFCKPEPLWKEQGHRMSAWSW